MSITTQIAKHFRDVHFGGNWTSVNLRDTLNDVSWVQATEKVYTFNTIAILVNHIHYYVSAVSKVLRGEALNAKDSLSFDHPSIKSRDDWEAFLAVVWKDAEIFSTLIEQLPDSRLEDDFTDKKYGNYYRNLQGIVEHIHYHLGQIVIIKKILQANQLK